MPRSKGITKHKKLYNEIPVHKAGSSMKKRKRRKNCNSAPNHSTRTSAKDITNNRDVEHSNISDVVDNNGTSNVQFPSLENPMKGINSMDGNGNGSNKATVDVNSPRKSHPSRSCETVMNGNSERNSSSNESYDSNSCRTNNSNEHHDRAYQNMVVHNHITLNDNTVTRDSDVTPDRNVSPNNNISIINTINYSNNSSINESETESHNNDTIPNNENLFTSYYARRRLVRKLKICLEKLGNVEQQGVILCDLLNSTDMEPVLAAGGITPPKEHAAKNLVVDQVLKQVSRSSTKNSTRGRTNDHLQSYRTNVVAALMPSPTQNSPCMLKNKDVYALIRKSTTISRSAARRLVNKARKHRSILTRKEKDTTWSIIQHRHGYDTKQKQLISKLLDWIMNHPHVVPSPIARDTVLVKVKNCHGEDVRERVGKLLLEISVRELHQDLMKPPPIGLAEVYCESTQKLMISERYLRNMLPPQLRAMSFAQKQMCGCEMCTIMRMHHTSLLMYRKKVCHKNLSSNVVTTRRRLNTYSNFDDYKSDIFCDNNHRYPNACDIMSTMMCATPPSGIIPKWGCIMGRCNSCPKPSIPVLELSSNSPLDRISFAEYRYHTKCKLHGLLKDKSNTCELCMDLVEKQVLQTPEKIVRKKEITMVDKPIHDFHEKVYIPSLVKYKYHINLVSVLSKNHCKAMRTDAFLNNPSWFLSERDYAERLVKELDGEIQSDHFGDNPTLSIEGCTLQYHDHDESLQNSSSQPVTRMDFHSHFADFSRQDAATTFEHICSMLDNHISRVGPLQPKAVFLDHTDGCAKQYRSGNALYLLNVICLKYDIVIDRAVCAPGHGKSIIDGLNAVDKHYLRKVMCMSGSTRPDNIETRMNMFGIIQNSNMTFAQECARLCGLENRKHGVSNSPYINKKGSKLSERIYHVQDPTTVRYVSISKGTKGWIQKSSQKGNGIRYHHNFRADPALGHGYIAARRIPCACDGCLHQLSLPWKRNENFGNQPRYKSDNKQCVLWSSLGSLNNWRLISFVDIDSSQKNRTSSVTKSIFNATLRSNSLVMSSLLEKGNYAAIATNDEAALSGYYICSIESTAYVLQNTHSLDNEIIHKGELVFDLIWLNQVPNCRTIFTHGLKGDRSLYSIARVQHIIDPDVKFAYLSSPHMLPKKLYTLYQELTSKNAIILENSCHDSIVESIFSRNHLEHSEYYDSSEDDDHCDSESDEEM